MKEGIRASIRKFLSRTASGVNTSDEPTCVDVREEYAHAFRTESYIDFWTRVLALSNEDSAKCIPAESTTAARLSSYRLFTEQLLDPDQPTVTRILSLVKTHSLLSDYFTETANASLLFGLLLKDINNIRVKYKSFKTIINSFENTTYVSPVNKLPGAMTRLTEFSNLLNPFGSSAHSLSRVRIIQDECSKLLKQLESSRNKARAKIRFINRSKHGSAVVLVALTVSLTVIIVSHGLALLVAAPGLIAASLNVASTRKLAKLSAQLDAAAKGTYILNRDLETISRLVTRLNDELEHMRSMVKFWLARKGSRLQAGIEVARQLKKNDASFRQQLDDLEEHLYLCFMTINRARNLVVKEILDPGQPATWLSM